MKVYSRHAGARVHMQAYDDDERTDEDISHQPRHTGTVRKLANLLEQEEILDSYQVRDHCVTMDSAYMEGITAQVGR